MNKRAILYIEKDDPCNEVKEALQSCKLDFEEWKVDKEFVDFSLPLLITGAGVYTGKEIMRFGPDLCNLLMQE